MANMQILWILCCVHVVAHFATSRGAAKVPAVIVFGDSSVDAGNNNQISTFLKSNFEPYGRDFVGARPTGRFSNGRIPPDFISEGFGLKPTVPAYLEPAYNISDFASGVCFASAGTGYDNATSDVLNVIPLWKELDYYKDYQKKLKAYLGEEKADTIIKGALYLMSLGTNDFLENYYAPQNNHRRSQFSIQQYEDFLVGIARNFITQLHSLGLRKLSLTGLPPMGCLPLERTENFLEGNNCVKDYNIIGLEFNKKLGEMALQLNKKLDGIKIVMPEVYHVLLQMITKPKSYGFEVASKACCGTGMFEMSYLCDKLNPFTCKDANKYIFWDSFHPTEKTNRLISEHILPRLLEEFS